MIVYISFLGPNWIANTVILITSATVDFGKITIYLISV